MIDLTPVRHRSGPARLLDVVPGRSKKVFKTWLAARSESWRGRVEVVAMDGFTGFKSAAGEELPQARAVMDPFHVVSLAGDKLDECRRRIQRAITGRRGRAGDRLYRARRTLLTGAGLLTDAQAERLEALFADDRHAAVQAAWGVYQRLIQAYRAEEAGLGKYLMRRLIDSLRQAVPDGLEEIQALARTLTERASDTPGLLRPPPYLQRPHRSHQRAPGAPTRHRPGIPQPHALHHPQPHPHRTPQRPPDSNHLNQPISPTYHTLKHEEPVNNSPAAVTTAVRADTRRACSEEKRCHSMKEPRKRSHRRVQTWRARLPAIFSALISPVSFPDQRGGCIPWPPSEDAGKGEVPVPKPAPADAYCQHEHKVGGAQALVQFSATSFR